MGLFSCLPTVGSCCCGCSLRGGALAIGIIESVVAALQLIGGAYMASLVGDLKKLLESTFGGGKLAVDNRQGEDVLADVRGYYAIVIIFAIYYAVVLVLSMILSHGARTGSSKFLLPWMYGVIPRILFMFSVSIAVMVKAKEYAAILQASVLLDDPSSTLEFNKDTMIAQGAVGLVWGVALLLYFLIVVRSFCSSLSG